MYLELLLLIPGALAVLLIHELGHLFAARWCDVPVSRIAIGLGPYLLSFTDRWGTRWALAMLPFGASCSIGGTHRNPLEQTAISAVRLGKEAFIYAAGPASNLILTAAIYLAASL